VTGVRGELDFQRCPRRITDDPLRPHLQALDAGGGVRFGHDVEDLGETLGADLIEHRDAQFVLVAEVRIDRTLRETRGVGDLLQRCRVIAVFEEELPGGLQQLRSGLSLAFGAGHPRHAAIVRH
jgi:hypothetical protein